jgi:hypothetical protein
MMSAGVVSLCIMIWLPVLEMHFPQFQPLAGLANDDGCYGQTQTGLDAIFEDEDRAVVLSPA